MSWKIPGEFVPMDVKLPSRPEIRKGGPDAELMFYRGLFYARTNQTGGLLPEYDLPAWSAGLRNVKKSCQYLVRSGLWETCEDGWRIPSWSKWNPTKEQRDELRAKKRKAAMVSNHRQGRHKIADPDCPLCTTGMHVIEGGA